MTVADIPQATDLNLDAMPVEDLEALASALGTLRVSQPVARRLFPDQPSGYRTQANNLMHYSWNKVTAMHARGRGDIKAALIYEGICDRIYERMADWAKGW